MLIDWEFSTGNYPNNELSDRQTEKMTAERTLFKRKVQQFVICVCAIFVVSSPQNCYRGRIMHTFCETRMLSTSLARVQTGAEKNNRPVPPRKKKNRRPVPPRKNKTTAPSRLGKKQQPLRPTLENKNKTSRSAENVAEKTTVPSRPAQKFHPYILP